MPCTPIVTTISIYLSHSLTISTHTHTIYLTNYLHTHTHTHTHTHSSLTWDTCVARQCTLSFPIGRSSTLHGFAGYFDCKLYGNVHISILPRTFSTGMFSWCVRVCAVCVRALAPVCVCVCVYVRV